MYVLAFFEEIRAAGVSLSVTPDGELKAKGEHGTLLAYMPRIRESKEALIRFLNDAKEDAREAFEERAAIMEFDGGLSRDEAERMARLDLAGALGGDTAPPSPPMTKEEEASIRDWLARIGETDPETIEDVIAGCAEKPDARAYFLWRASDAVDKLFGNRRK